MASSSVRNGTGSGANSDVAGRQERFVLMDTNGGCVESGDVVFLRTADGSYLRSYGDWRRFDARGTSTGPWARLVVGRQGGGVIRNRDTITLQTAHGHYVAVARGGGGVINANGTRGNRSARFTSHRRRVVAGREPVRPIPSTGLRELHHRTRRPAASRAARYAASCFNVRVPALRKGAGPIADSTGVSGVRPAGRPTRSERRRCRRRRYRSHSPSLGGRFPPPH